MKNLRSYRTGRRMKSFGPGSTIGKGVRVYNPGGITIGSNTRIDDNVCLNGLGDEGLRIGDRCQIRFGSLIDCWKGKGISIGNDCFIGPYSVIQGQGGVEIGDKCLIGGHAYIVPANHIFADGGRPIIEQGETRVGIKVGDDVWMGSGVRLLDGVSVGEGCVIGAGSVVTRSLPRNSVAYGVPAKLRRTR
jgi:acetyltransferase-like isoleucine patch superfamily enzyme